MAERQPTALDLVSETERLGSKQRAALNERLFKYLRDENIVPDQTTFRQAAEVIVDALRRGLAQTDRPSIRSVVNLGLAERERIVSKAGNLVAESTRSRGFGRHIDPVGPYAISRALLEAADAEVKNFALSPSLENCEALLDQVALRRGLVEELSTSYLRELLGTGMLGDATLEDLSERVSAIEDKARIVRGGILASLFELDTPVILVSGDVQEALDRYQALDGVPQEGTRFLKSDLASRLTSGSEHFVDDIVRQNVSILENWLELLESSTGLDRKGYEYKIRLSSFFEAYLPILLPGLEEPIITDISKIDMARESGLKTLWDEENSVVINGHRVPKPDILSVVQRGTRRPIIGTFGTPKDRLTVRALGAWRIHDRLIREGPEVVAKAQQRVKSLEEEYEALKKTPNLPDGLINSYTNSLGSAERYGLLGRRRALRKRVDLLQRAERKNGERFQELEQLREWLATAGPEDEFSQVVPVGAKLWRLKRSLDYLERRLADRKEAIEKHTNLLESGRLTPKGRARRQALLELAQRRIPEIEADLAKTRESLREVEESKEDTAIIYLTRKQVEAEFVRLTIYTITPAQLSRLEGRIGTVRRAARFIHGETAARYVYGPIPGPGEYEEWKSKMVERISSASARAEFLWIAEQMEQDSAMFPTLGLEGTPWRTYRSKLEVRINAADALVPAKHVRPQLQEIEEQIRDRAKEFHLKRLERRIKAARNSLREKRKIDVYARRMLLETMQKLNFALPVSD